MDAQRGSSGRRLRILELRSVLGTGGGPEKTILLGAAQADRDAFDVTVAYIRDRRDGVFSMDRRAAEAGVDYVEVVERHSFDWKIWPQLKRLIKDRQIDIIHAHEHKTDVLALLLSRSTGAIPLSTAHGWSGRTRRDRLLYYPMDKRILARFPRVIAVSTKIKEELVRHGADPGRIEVILNAVDTSSFRRSPDERVAVRASLALDNSDFVIGAVGRLERVKRFDLLLEAFAVVVRQHVNARLIIVGDGSLRAELLACAERLGLSGAVRWLGHRDDIPQLYQAFDLLVQASETEGTPNAVLEAMATEVPLVATDVGGTRELARPSIDGLIVPKLDVAALIAGIEDVIRHPEGARTRATSARERAETDLSFRARTRRLERLYQDLIRDGRGRTRA
jgi:glycosyltransferase involved in cell wall biosynthesis